MNFNQLSIISLLFLFVFCTYNSKEEFVLKASDFQKTIDGKVTNLYLLKNDKIKVYITNYGGRIVSLLTPDRYGQMGDVVLGFKSIDDYLSANGPYHGALIGRVGNRIAKGKFTLDGKTYSLPINNNWIGLSYCWKKPVPKILLILSLHSFIILISRSCGRLVNRIILERLSLY